LLLAIAIAVGVAFRPTGGVKPLDVPLRQSDLPRTRDIIEVLNRVKIGFEVGISYRDFMPLYRELAYALAEFDKSGEGGQVPPKLQQKRESGDKVEAWEAHLTLGEISDIRYDMWQAPEGNPELSPQARRIALNVWMAAALYDNIAGKWQKKVEAAGPARDATAGFYDDLMQIIMPKAAEYTEEADRLFRELEP